MHYRVEVIPSAIKSLAKIDPQYARNIRLKIDLLEIDPRHNGCKKMSGKENTYRTRVGKYRIIYEIYDEKVYVLVIGIDHRKDVYR